MAAAQSPAPAAPPALAAGLRASVLTTLPVAAAILLERPLWYWMAIGGWLVSLGDTGAAYATRARAMLSITLFGGLVCLGLGCVALEVPTVVPVIFVVVFGLSLARAVGDMASAVGAMLVIVAIIALGAPAKSGGVVAERAAMFVAGGLASTLLALASWRVHPYNPARRAVAESLDALADTARELSALLEKSAGMDEWHRWVPAFHRRVRQALEAAQEAVVATRLSRADTAVTDRLEVLLEQEDRIFEALVALADELEGEALAGTAPAGAAAALARVEEALRRLRDATLERDDGERTRTNPPRPPPGAWGEGPVASILERIDRALDVAVVAPRPVASLVVESYSARELGRALLGLRAHLTPKSHAFVHATRVAIATTLAAIVVRVASLPYGTWAVLTAAVCLQPSTEGTWARTVERIVGTVLGAAAAALITHVAPHPATVVVVFAVATFAAVALKPVRYVYFVLFLTPPFALFAELGQPRGAAVGARVLNTVLGGALAVATASVFFRRADSYRLRSDVADALERERQLLGRVAAQRRGDPGATMATVREARRQVGLANNNAEDTLKELAGARGPGQAARASLGAALAYGRRLVATIVSTAEETPLRVSIVPEGRAAVERVDALLAATVAQLRGEDVTVAVEPIDPATRPMPARFRRMEWLTRLIHERVADALRSNDPQP